MTGKRRLPIWTKFTSTFYEQNLQKSFLCRLRTIVNEDLNSNSPQESTATEYGFDFSPTYGASELPSLEGISVSNPSQQVTIEHKEEFNLPIYDQYFILEGEGVTQVAKTIPPSGLTSNPPKITTESIVPPPKVGLSMGGVVPDGYGQYGDK